MEEEHDDPDIDVKQKKLLRKQAENKSLKAFM